MKNRNNPLILEVFEYFVNNPYEKIHLREFSRKQKISLNTAQRFLNKFLSQGLIKEKREANLRYFKANIDSLLFRHIKKCYSIKKIEDSGILEELKKHYNTLILFGSVAKGEDDKNSDIDLVGIGKPRKPNLDKYEKRLKKEINLHSFKYHEWKKTKEKNKAFYQDVISSGINLIGEMPLVS